MVSRILHKPIYSRQKLLKQYKIDEFFQLVVLYTNFLTQLRDPA